VLGVWQSCLGIGFSVVSWGSVSRSYEDRYLLGHEPAQFGTCILNYMALVLIILNFGLLPLQYHLRDSARKSPFVVILSQYTYPQPNSVTSVLILLLKPMVFKTSPLHAVYSQNSVLATWINHRSVCHSTTRNNCIWSITCRSPPVLRFSYHHSKQEIHYTDQSIWEIPLFTLNITINTQIQFSGKLRTSDHKAGGTV
jgi:hypothetical protein